jgi:hypothetical protein
MGDSPDDVIQLPITTEADQPIADDDIEGQVNLFLSRLFTTIPDPTVHYQVAAALHAGSPGCKRSPLRSSLRPTTANTPSANSA